MQPFLFDIEGLLTELDMAVQMYEVELRDQGYSAEEAAKKAATDTFKLKQKIVRRSQV